GTPDSVIITIFTDNQVPTSTSPADSEYEANSTSTFTQWILYDNAASGNYSVQINGSTYLGWNSWTNGTNITIAVDTNRGLGDWNYTIFYNDSSGNWGTADNVIINIYEEQSNGEAEEDANIPGFIIAVGSTIAIVIVIIFILKKMIK
ncbi:MAG: hypothetical protein ACTSWY_08950, partial [Promethearchaeota archaeon]